MNRFSEVRAVNLLFGYDYTRFPWKLWHFHWTEADAAYAAPAALTAPSCAVTVSVTVSGATFR